jgi:hypothetical protein
MHNPLPTKENFGGPVDNHQENIYTDTHQIELPNRIYAWLVIWHNSSSKIQIGSVV